MVKVKSLHIESEGDVSVSSLPVTLTTSQPNCASENLSITRENGRGLITYGVTPSSEYNMKSCFLRLVIFISCSVCAFADLEIYPGVNFEDQDKNLEITDDSLLPLYVAQRGHELPFSKLEERYFGASLEGFRNRITDRYKALQKDIYNKQNKMKQRTLNSYKHMVIPEFPDRNDDDFRRFITNEFDRSKYPNSQILGDSTHEESDFIFNNEDDNEMNDNFKDSYNGQSSKDGENLIGSENGSDARFKFVPLDDPTKFAYAPPDPRFYEDFSPTEVMSQRQAYKDEAYDSDNDVDASSMKFVDQTDSISNLDSIDDPRQRTDSTVKVVAVRPNPADTDTAGVYIIAVVAGISAAATVGLIAFGIGWYNLQKHVKNASDVEYPAYGITGPNKEISPSGDRRLAQSAQMYHYQHQKQQIIAMERAAGNERHGSVSEADSDEENEEGDYTVYECPGLAPTGEMEVKNPLFQDDPTPAQTPAVKASDEAVQKK